MKKSAVSIFIAANILREALNTCDVNYPQVEIRVDLYPHMSMCTFCVHNSQLLLLKPVVIFS